MMIFLFPVPSTQYPIPSPQYLIPSPKADESNFQTSGGCIILNLALGTTGHVGTWVLDPNATLRERQGRTGDSTSTHSGEILCEQVGSMNEESPP